MSLLLANQSRKRSQQSLREQSYILREANLYLSEIMSEFTENKFWRMIMSKFYRNEQNSDTRSQVKEELCQHVEEHCETFIVKSVKEGSQPCLRTSEAIF